jgi:hypothetical protein
MLVITHHHSRPSLSGLNLGQDRNAVKRLNAPYETFARGANTLGVLFVSFAMVVAQGSFSMAWAGDARNQVAITTLSDSPSMSSASGASENQTQLNPEDLNARGQELDNTFYEIEGMPPYTAPPSTPANAKDYGNEHTSGIATLGKEIPWSVWAAGAAGLVGLGALGYMTLSEEEPKTAEKKVTVIRDK